ncbi:coiled-coil domain-containing protein 186 isoform X2 [Helicoverpa zea]|uniref:coiled-coil domain-containing protein 186 isoform X2 n=1 Tax=Helicoverpa zea TaxID=7113 RepID=UPI001F58768F|nr:coiled-coil domain-containing protein 186 isoform X2 [Helicoverpa zea]
MSTELEENEVHIESVDVNEKVKENGSMGETICDSGLDTLDSCSAAFPASDSELSPIKNIINHDLGNGTSTDSLSNESSLSSPGSEDGVTNNLNFEFPQKTDVDLAKELIMNCIESMNIDETDGKIDQNGEITDFKDTDYNNVNRPLTTSTVSLNEHKCSENNVMCKSPFSKSAENISNISYTVPIENASLNSSDKELNADKILSDFASQKTKVSAVHKIPENLVNIDPKYTRIPKELLSQDIGSIVKNVHGIFSSVSGSLKSAYTHRTSYNQKPVKNTKNLPNGKLMNDIFEDENVDTKTEIPEKVETTEHQEIIPNSNVEVVIPKTTEADTTEVGDAKKDVMRLQIESLERVLAEQRKENASLRDRVKQQCDELQQKDMTFKELEVKLDMMGKRVDHAEREKDAAVMRYASVECAAIEAKRAAENAAKAEKAAQGEVELLNGKLRSAHAEKQRICQLYDDKCHELMNSERELAKLREDLRELDGRLKWTQSKLRMEMDAYKETSERAEKLTQQVTELEAAKEAATANATDSARAKQLEAELKESQAALILCRHERDELERRLTSATQQLDSCTRQRDTASAALARSTAEVEQLKESNLRLEEEAAELAALRAKAALADTLSAQLQRETERATQAEEALSVERAVAETCGRREAAALEHAAKLTANHVAVSAAASRHEAEARALGVDNASLRERLVTLEGECTRLHAALAEETDRRNKENRVLARKVAELTEELSEANKKLEWEKGENGVLKKKHTSAIKELNRELQRAVKRCEQLEAKLPQQLAPSTRTGSVSSLSSGESAPHEDRLHNGHSDALPDIQVREPDRQTLIERIVSLQRAAARRSERCEFLEEHSRQLTSELRAKSRLLRHLLCTLPAGAVASSTRDENKKEIARLGGGAMAAVWGGDPTGLPAELSLEMTRRLQAVLEDTLLKNITLKENMDTLGAEISRLKEQLKSASESK